MNLGKIMKMKQEMESIQAQLGDMILEASGGGGAVKVTITGHAEFQSLTIDPSFLREEAAETVQVTILETFKDASAKAKALQMEKMGSMAQGLGGLPGF